MLPYVGKVRSVVFLLLQNGIASSFDTSNRHHARQAKSVPPPNLISHRFRPKSADGSSALTRTTEDGESLRGNDIGQVTSQTGKSDVVVFAELRDGNEIVCDNTVDAEVEDDEEPLEAVET